MSDTTTLYEYRCLECGYAWRSHNPEKPRCPDCESGDIVTIAPRVLKRMIHVDAS